MDMDRYERLIMCEYLAKHCDAATAWDSMRSFIASSRDIAISTDLSQLRSGVLAVYEGAVR